MALSQLAHLMCTCRLAKALTLLILTIFATDRYALLLCEADIYLVGVAWYTDVMVRYIPRFGGHGSTILVQQGKKTNPLCSVSFHLF